MNLKSNKGFTLVEMVIVMFLMGILGTLVMNFMINGGVFYKKVYTDYDARNEARLAVHCVTNTIRQNDAVDTIYVKNNKIRFIPRDGNGIKQKIIDIVYSEEEKKLYECVGEISKTNVDNLSEIDIGYKNKMKIGDISSFKVIENEGTIFITVGYIDSSKVEKKYEECLTLRSYN